MTIREPTRQAIFEAAEALLRGELVGMPTETVYGLAAVAANREAVMKIFVAKGRPADNPLIVHLASVRDLDSIAQDIPEVARMLAEAFWPGPLTVILRKRAVIPDEVTAGLDTVAVRIPDHPVALALIEAARAPLAAPSANAFMSLSPTRAEDIDAAIASRLAMTLDGGPARVGVESTVVDCTVAPLRILRPGGISRAEIESLIGPLAETEPGGPARSPGQYPRHYAPRTPLRIVEYLTPQDAGLRFSPPATTKQIKMPVEASAFAARLYAALHELDLMEVPEILVECPPKLPEWEAVWDRLQKSATSTK